MGVEWHGDHKLLEELGEKQEFERELGRLGYNPSEFIVVVRREPDVQGPGGIHPVRYKVHVTRLGADQETLTFNGGHGNAWVAQFVQDAANRARTAPRK